MQKERDRQTDHGFVLLDLVNIFFPGSHRVWERAEKEKTILKKTQEKKPKTQNQQLKSRVQ
jgi:hypothetical protein